MSSSETHSATPNEPGYAAPTRFATTRWSIVRAVEGTASNARRALEELCRTYWHPLYAYARRRGHQANDAQHLTQGFIASLLQ